MKRMKFTKWFGLSLVVLLLFPLATALAEDGDSADWRRGVVFHSPLL